MTRKIPIKGYRVDNAGKLVPCLKHLPVNIQLQRRAGKRVRVRKSGPAGPVPTQ